MTLAIASVLTGCQSFGLFSEDRTDIQPGTLATLEPLETERSPELQTSVSLDEVIDGYENLLPLLDDPARIVQVHHRLADLRFQKAENRMVEQAVDELDIAVDAYHRLLEKYPERDTNDQVLYQLGKAYEMQGNRDAYLQTLDRLVAEYPDSEFRIEAEFRRGELLFVDGYYDEAQDAFDTVIALSRRNENVRFLADAYFMKGWSQFKLLDYDDSLISFTRVLDNTLPDDPRLDAVEQKYQTLVEDVFRVMGLAFTHLGGADSLEALFEEVGSKPYEVLIYDRYSQLLISKEQYTDAIEVYERFIASHADSPWAPRYHVAIIDTLQKAGFTQEIAVRKAAFVRDYGVGSDYWRQTSDANRGYLREQLEPLLTELANRHYVLAQRAEQANRTAEARREYAAAANYYGEFVATFPNHERTPEMHFLLAETQLALENWPEAIEAFEWVAYNYGAHDRAAEAGYAAVLAYRDYLEFSGEMPETERDRLLVLQQESRLDFVHRFPEDARAIDILYIATQRDFEQENDLDVIAHAQQIIDWRPAAPADMVVEARLLKAHALYRLEDYRFAEEAYQEALQAMPEQDQRRGDIRENLAASVYRQGEDYLAAGNLASAVDEFLRVGAVAPESSLRANAEYDAANYLVELAQWDRAIEVMTAFRANYPQHEMIDTLPAKMALAYRETGQWEQAADESQRMVGLATTDEEKRETLYIAAELYDRAGNKPKAITTWRDYANRYPQPLADYMEAANRLAKLYDETGEPAKRRYWLNAQMAAVDRYPDAADDRARYQAAEASAILADEAYQAYGAIDLTLPLEQTLPAKMQALEAAVNAYQKTVNYGVADFSTEAGYRIADLYAQLGSDLIDSERPDNLSELELMQYELLLEEQAYPFEENAIDIHEQNARRAWEGLYDKWVRESFQALSGLLPGRYNKPEATPEVIDEVR
ncbi:tetratricopeptide repeat protein [Marinobacter nanhaiticus D15-8W]|nr:tetratricopeptide repeat protein [Marinobacter nanhaiticus D15-8W]